MSHSGRWLTGTVLALAGMIAVVLFYVRFTFDLAFFLPKPATEQEAVLVERLGQGPGSNLIFIELAGNTATPIDEESARLKALLERSDLFARVDNGQGELSFDRIPQPLWQKRYLLADVDWSVAGLSAALRERQSDLIALGGDELSRLIASDPVWAAPRILENLQFRGPGGGPRWFDGPDRGFLVVETHAPPFDIGKQHAAIEVIKKAHDQERSGRTLDLYGVGVYSVRVQDLVQSEAQLLGLLSTAAVLTIVAWAYRSRRLTLISVIPLASAVLGGTAAAGLAFGKIHGITLAFGATLVGVVDDYPMHLFSHARHMSPRSGVKLLWRTLLASAGTAIVAYAALIVSDSRGLAQLGVFSVTGILCAIAVTCWVLPHLINTEPPAVAPDSSPQQFMLTARVWLPLLALGTLILATTGGVHWNDNLGELTPLPASLLARDRSMRTRFGAPDVRYLITITGDSVESVLQRTEALASQLGEARTEGLLESWSAVTGLLPSRASQERRRAAIPSSQVLKERLAVSRAGLPFRADAFTPFLEDVARSLELPPVQETDLTQPLLSEYLSSHLTKVDGQWRSAVFLNGLRAPEQLADWLRARHLDAQLVDLKAASESLVRGYRNRLTSILTGAVSVIAILLLWFTGSLSRFLWAAGTIAASVLITLAVMNWLHGSVSLFHLVSLVLVAGLGADYCLFYSKPQVTRAEFADTRHAITACAASTAGAFAILGFSSIPLLATVGTTVAMGTFITYIAARGGCRA